MVHNTVLPTQEELAALTQAASKPTDTGHGSRVVVGPHVVVKAHRERAFAEVAYGFARVTRHLECVIQPFGTPAPKSGYWLTVWPRVPHSSQPVQAKLLARALRQIHQSPRHDDSSILQSWVMRRDRDSASRRHRVVQQAGDPDMLGLLAEINGRKSEVLAAGRALLHGDVYPGNVISSDGQPTLIDYDSALFGAVEWDLGTVVASSRLGMVSHEYVQEVLEAYGAELDEDRLEAAAVVRTAGFWSFRHSIAGSEAMRRQARDEVRRSLAYKGGLGR